MSNISIVHDDFEFSDWMDNVVDALYQVEKLQEDQLSVVIIGDNQMQELNNNYRGKNKPTDVLTFAECDVDENWSDSGYLGEVFIDFDQVKRQSKDWKNEILHLLIHGYLHTKGYIHDTDQEQEEMDIAGEKVKDKIKEILK